MGIDWGKWTGYDAVTGTGKQILSGAGLGPAPNAWDAKGNSMRVQGNAQGVYDQAMTSAANAQASGPNIGRIHVERIAAPNAIQAQQVATPNGISVNDVGVSDLVAGQEAADLRAKQLQQGETAANSPSSAAAQMRAAGAQIQGQQAAMAAQARGQNRAAARRDAMLATGNLGMQAANQTAALAAQENMAKQQAYSQTLAGVRAGDVQGANAQASVGLANQGANLQAQQITNAQALQAGQLNQGANLNAQQYTAQNQLEAGKANQTAGLQGQIAQQGNTLGAWTAQQQAAQGYMGLANQATANQNASNATWAQYATGQNTANQKQNAGLTSTVTSIAGGFLSDSRSKEDVARFGSSMGGSGLGAALMKISRDKAAVASGQEEPSPGISLPGGMNLSQAAQAYGARGSGQTQPGYSGKLIPENDIFGAPTSSNALVPVDDIFGSGAASSWKSDEKTKRAVAQMSGDDLINWADKTDLATYRYKPGVADSGATPQVGVSSAQRLEQTGPLGKLMVNEGPDGLKWVDYPKLSYAVGKAALEKANQNEDLYARLARDVQVANQRNNRSRKGA
jgi:hypothetical protein